MKSVCKRCGVIHTAPAADPKKILDKLAKEMAKAIDLEVLDNIRREHKDEKTNA